MDWISIHIPQKVMNVMISKEKHELWKLDPEHGDFLAQKYELQRDTKPLSVDKEQPCWYDLAGQDPAPCHASL